QVAIAIGLDNLQVLNGDPGVTHLARPLGALEDASRRRARAAGSWRALAVGLTVRPRTTLEAVPLDDAGEALALRGADDVDHLADLEHRGVAPIADRDLAAVGAQLAQVAQRRGLRLVEVSTLRRGQLLRLAEADLDGLVAVLLLRPDLGDITRSSFDDRDRD